MISEYRYGGEWGEVPSLHSVCTMLKSHQERETTAAVEIGYFLSQYATECADYVKQIRAAAEQMERAKADGVGDEEIKPLRDWRKREKMRSPCIIPAGYYPQGHAASDKCEPTNLLCVDIDRKDNLHISTQEWGNLPADLLRSTFGKYCVFVGESQSGWERGGYFVLVLLSGVDDFSTRFAAVEKWFAAAGVKIDPAAKNINHCRAVSYQDNSTRAGFCTLPQVNAAAVPFGSKLRPKIEPPKYFAAKNYSGQDDYSRAARACNYIHSHQVNICETFESWTKCAFALAAAFGMRGEDLFLQCASVSPKFNERENRRKYQNALQTHNGRTDVASFWYLLRAAGVDIAQFGK